MIWLVFFILGILAWMVSTLGAGGGAILFLPIAGLMVEPRDVPPIIAIAAAVSSVQRCWLYRHEIELPILGANLPGIAAGSLLGASLLRGLDGDGIGFLLGAFLVVYALTSLLGWGLTLPPARPIHFALASFFTAAVSAVVGASGPIMNPVYLQAGVLKERMIGTKAASSLAMQIVKVAAFLSLGLLRPELWAHGLVVGGGALIGNAAGKRLLGRMTVSSFAKLVQGMLLISGSLILFRSMAEG